MNLRPGLRILRTLLSIHDDDADWRMNTALDVVCVCIAANQEVGPTMVVVIKAGGAGGVGRDSLVACRLCLLLSWYFMGGGGGVHAEVCGVK